MNFEYLDLLEKKLDPVQKECCCSEGNTIVAAGAGSGKTQVLATRFAWLVMSKGIPVSKILTLTFTKKAAGEMYERIYKTLSFFAENPETPEAERKRAQEAIIDFSESKIKTLDSYCTGIVKQAANMYGIRPDFTSGSADSESDIKNLALPFVFKNQDRLCIKTFANPGAYQDFSEKILSEAIIKHTSIATEKNYFKNKLEYQKKIISKAYNYFILGDISEDDHLFSFAKEDIKNWCTKNSLPAFYSFKSWVKEIENYFNEDYNGKGKDDNFLADFALGSEKFFELSRLILNTKISFTEINIEEITKIKNALNTIFKFCKKLNANKGGKGENTLDSKRYIKTFRDDVFASLYDSILQFIFDYNALLDFANLTDEFTQIVNNAKRDSGNLTFTDVSELALKIIQTDKEIQKQEQDAYSIIMIDEFQDNNGKNRDLLFALCGNQEKLFFVGDEKQSIYKFRGADVSVFNSLKRDSRIRPAKAMIYNYRSSHEMISAFNNFFNGDVSIFENSSEEDYEARYIDRAIKYDPKIQQELPDIKLTEKNVPIHLCMYNTNAASPDNDTPDLDKWNRLGYFIASKIYELKLENSKLKFSDFAILDRSRTHRHYITKWLNHFNIPYTIDANTSLFSDGPVNDIYNYLRLCVYPDDKKAYAGFLASPFCGKDFNEIVNELSKDTEFKLPERNEILSQPLTKTLSYLWINLGYYYETIQDPKTSLLAEQFDLLFEIARKCENEGKSLSWFVDQLCVIRDNEAKAFNDDVEISVKDIKYPVEKNDSIQFMSIHKSKGLQFEHVFIYGITGVKTDSRGSKFFFDEETGPSLVTNGGKLNLFYNLNKLKAQKKELAEFRRVLYVAITRAIKSIYIAGYWNPKSSNQSNAQVDFKLLENLAGVYYSALTGDFNTPTEKPIYAENAPFDYYTLPPLSRKEAYAKKGKTKTNSIKDIFQNYQGEPAFTMPELLSNRKTPSSLEINTKAQSFTLPLEEFDSDSGEKFENETDLLTKGIFTAADFGTLVHSYLEAQANNIKPEEFEPEAKLLKNLNPKEAEEKKQTCIKMCHDFKESTIGQKFEEAKKNARFYKAEYAFRMFHNSFIFTGSIDLIFQNADGTYTIVDYKSDNEIDNKKYEGQQACYRTAASKLLNLPEDKFSCSLYYLKHNKEERLFND